MTASLYEQIARLFAPSAFREGDVGGVRRADREAALARASEAVRLVLERSPSQVARLCEELAWYGEQARLARLVHSGGDEGRRLLSEDGGKRAAAALAPSPEAPANRQD